MMRVLQKVPPYNPGIGVFPVETNPVSPIVWMVEIANKDVPSVYVGPFESVIPENHVFQDQLPEDVETDLYEISVPGLVYRCYTLTSVFLENA